MSCRKHTLWNGYQYAVAVRSGRFAAIREYPMQQAEGTDASDFATAAATGRWTEVSGFVCLSRRRVCEPGRPVFRRQGNPSGRERMRRRPRPWPAAGRLNFLSSSNSAEA